MSKIDLAATRATIRAHMIVNAEEAMPRLIKLAGLSEAERRKIADDAADLVRTLRRSSKAQLMESVLAEYSLSSREGIALMCLAEALLRVPDDTTIDDLIADKIVGFDWATHTHDGGPLFINASAWALMLTGKVLEDPEKNIAGELKGLLRRMGEPVIRNAVGAVMRVMGAQFVLGETMNRALKNGDSMAKKGYLYSFDMLGEAARTQSDADRYYNAYVNSLRRLGEISKSGNPFDNHGISVKLSALHPRYELAQADRAVPELSARLVELARMAAKANVTLAVDAEEMDRLDPSLDIIEAVMADPALADWRGLGIVVQAYSGRAPFVIDWLDQITQKLDRRISVRLVKGAYWDAEIKRAQVMGLDGFPVFGAKVQTDVSYMACARKLLTIGPRIFPQFATHNAHTIAAIREMAPAGDSFEFQRLHGMGESLHETVKAKSNTRCRIYAPVGAHEDLLAYLVRRLLENGANSSFVHKVMDKNVAPEAIVGDPIGKVLADGTKLPKALALPKDIFGPVRINSRGYDIWNPTDLDDVLTAREAFAPPHVWDATKTQPVAANGDVLMLVNPSATAENVGRVRQHSADQVTKMADIALKAQTKWAARNVADRAALMRQVADLYETHTSEFFALLAREAGKTLADAISEVREAVDFLRFYADEADGALQGAKPRGLIGCISPWNFPLAIFTGQVAAALVTGNVVIAKPAEQTPLIAAKAVALMHEAGIPIDVVQLLFGLGETVGAALVAEPRIGGICFTGSTVVARIIEKQLAETAAPNAMLIAETGGLNAMVVDSTALPEQAVRDILASSFQSAGQRCSALRLLYVQEDIADKLLTMLEGAMHELRQGNPWAYSTDVGPLIDADALEGIGGYCKKAEANGTVVARNDPASGGHFVAPHVVKVGGIADLGEEIFGPVLHVATFKAEELDRVLTDVNKRGYGLTFALHSRIEARVQHVVGRLHVGNIYINRNQIGAVVGSQPFGGEGLSGTGPKAGGPFYLHKFVTTDGARALPTVNVSDDRADITWPTDTGLLPIDARLTLLRDALGEAAKLIDAAGGMDWEPRDLPGPTGESNTLLVAPRGDVLCLGPDADHLRAQVALALATGNRVAAVATGASAVLKSFSGKGLPLVVYDRAPTQSDLAEPELDLVALDADANSMRVVKRALAARSGAVVPVVAAGDAHGFVLERTVSIDTTAAGGNASLLANIDG